MKHLLENNSLYEYLSNKESPFINDINELYSFCNDLLKEIPKTFSNYTLHDIEHSVRVIGYMSEFIEKTKEDYSDLHIAMIFMAGLLHDIGMVASYDEIAKLESRLSTKDCPLDSAELKDKVQEYIRKHHAERSSSMIDTIDIKEGSTLKSLFTVGKSYAYSDELALICQSHMESVEWIVEKLPTEREIADYIVYPQQIAFLLRLGDILDIDDRRAPAFLARILNIKGYSATEWAKHIPIENYRKISIVDNHFVIHFSGKCRDADIYRRILLYINDIESDVVKINKAIETSGVAFSLPLLDKIENKIVTVGFETAELSFQLDYKKVVTLLMGENIYGDKKAGLRELIQNSIDAVLAMREREHRDSFSRYESFIGIRIDKENDEITIYDNGIGMNKKVIENYFFKVGNSYYTSDEFRSLNPKYRAIGHYGIGFLACFMLSKYVVLETQSKGEEPIIIEFEKDSPYVTKRNSKGYALPEGHGTKIILRYKDVIGEVFENEEKLISYVESTFLTDQYKLVIEISETKESKEIKTELKEQNSIYIASPELDICYQDNGFPDMIRSTMQLADYSDVMFYYSGQNKFDWEDSELSYISVDYLLEEVDGYSMNMGDDLDYPDPRTIIAEERVGIALDSIKARINSSIEDYKEAVDKAILSTCYEEGRLLWWRIPFLTRQVYLDSFERLANSVDYETAFSTYEDFFRYLIVLGTRGKIDSNVLINMINEAVELCDGDAVYSADSYTADFLVDNYIKPEEKWIGANRAQGGDYYLPIENFYPLWFNDTQEKVYMHGVKVEDQGIILPQMIIGTSFNKLFVNIHSQDLCLNVARNKLDNDSSEMLGRMITKIIYSDMLNRASDIISSDEKEEIKKFIDEI